MNTQLALVLPSSTSLNTVIINARCTLRVQEDQRVIMVAGLPVHHSRADEMVAEAYAMVLLVELGFAQQTQVVRAFGRSKRTRCSQYSGPGQRRSRRRRSPLRAANVWRLRCTRRSPMYRSLLDWRPCSRP